MVAGRAVMCALAVALTRAGCNDDPTTPPLSTCAVQGPLVDIVDNHLPSGGDHRLVVPPEDVLAGVTQTYDIRGDNVGHTHSVTLTDVDFASLRRGEPVTVVSSNNETVGSGHTHVVNLTCP